MQHPIPLFIRSFLTLLIMLLKRLWKQNGKLVAAALIILFIAIINDILAASDIYRFVYVSEYAFMFTIMAKSRLLVNKFLDLHDEVEALNVNLEKKVEERTMQLAEANESLKELALCDSLTGLRNRRYINEYVLDYVENFLKRKITAVP